ncbi:MAG: nitroreductase [Clostridium butyricum]|nr:nitroreductase [Clostridium butyricum]
MEIKKEWYKAIKIRKSRRSYKNEKISKDKLNNVNNLIAEINKESGLNIQLVENANKLLNGFKASYGMISGCNYLIAMVGKRNASNIKNTIGYYGEFIVLECTNLELGTCWICGSYNKKLCKESISLEEDDELFCIVSLGIVNKEKNLKEKLIEKLSKNLKQPEELLIEKDKDIPEWVKLGLEAAAEAPSALNRKPVGYAYLTDKIRIFVTKANHDYEEIDLGISMAHFMLGALEAGYFGTWKFEKREYFFY